MTEMRDLFCEAVDATAPLLSETALGERFDGPSALAEFSVRGLAGHLLRSMTSAEGYLDAPEPAGGQGSAPALVSAAAYYARIFPGENSLDSDFNRAIRQRAMESAPAGAEDFAFDWAETAARVTGRLEGEPADRLVQVYGGHVLTLDDYLVTRLVEVAVHLDDLAVSLDLAPPDLPEAATDLVIDTLVAVARARHGDTAVVRALTRRERDTVEALRVL
jgi:hypothetical protein